MCLVSLVSKYRRGIEEVPKDLKGPWNAIKPLVPTKKVEEFNIREIHDLIEAYNTAREYDIAHNESNCHEKIHHEELSEISKDLAVNTRKAIQNYSYEEASVNLKLMQSVDNTISALNKSCEVLYDS